MSSEPFTDSNFNSFDLHSNIPQRRPIATASFQPNSIGSLSSHTPLIPSTVQHSRFPSSKPIDVSSSNSINIPDKRYLLVFTVFLCLLYVSFPIQTKTFGKSTPLGKIDIVYTWVNGSDPLLKKEIEHWKLILEIDEEVEDSEPDSNETVANDAVVESRYLDNNELLYSLRSLYRFTPWIRNIYLVTNGQVPIWLNLDHPQIHLIPHSMIFSNQSHLPTFSSPAIESNLHRIPGLADNFIYLNDDVLFGRPVSLSDFYTQSSGQKIFLSWPVPYCNEGCPPSWIGDGFCDIPCNCSECDWDGGDCEGQSPSSSSSSSGSYIDRYQDPNNDYFCAPSCANSWQFDKFCDAACDNPQCAFDHGDCGFDSYKLYIVPNLNTEPPPGGLMVYKPAIDEIILDISPAGGSVFQSPLRALVLNFSTLFPDSNDFILGTSNNDTEIIRTSNVRSPERLFFATFFRNKTYSSISIEISGKWNHNVSCSLIDALPKEVFEYASNQCLNNSVEQVHFDNHFVSFVRIIKLSTQVLDTNISPTESQSFQAELNLSQEKNDKNISDNDFSDILIRSYSENTLDEQTVEKSKSNTNTNSFSETIPLDPDSTPSSSTFQKTGESSSFNSRDLTGISPEKPDIFSDQSKHMIFTLFSLNPHLFKEINPKLFSQYLDYDYESLYHFSSVLEKEQALDILSSILEKYAPNREYVSKLDRISKKSKVIQFQPKPAFATRNLLDMFGDSLKFTNALFNSKFPDIGRSVPAHMPHFIQKHVYEKLAASFPEEHLATSSHKFRHSQDLQYMFSYVYYLMQHPHELNIQEFFDIELDVDHDGYLSENEYRTLLILFGTDLSSLLQSPFTAQELEENVQGGAYRSQSTKELFEGILLDHYLFWDTLRFILWNNGTGCDIGDAPFWIKPNETETDISPMFSSSLSTIEFNDVIPYSNRGASLDAQNICTHFHSTMENFTEIESLVQHALFYFKINAENINNSVIVSLLQNFAHDTEADNRFELATLDEVTFQMISSNISSQITKLDSLRRKRTKFICLNDNMNHSIPESTIVQQSLQNFYQSFLPHPSPWEHKPGVFNTFFYYNEYLDFKTRQRHWKIFGACAIFFVFLIYLLIRRNSLQNDFNLPISSQKSSNHTFTPFGFSLFKKTQKSNKVL